MSHREGKQEVSSALEHRLECNRNFSQKNLLALLLTWVLWTPNPLISAKSPCVVYVSNLRLLVHPLLIDFGGGSSCCSSWCSCCSCCCCCDRGKTKSTPSPKTEVWTLDQSLTIINPVGFKIYTIVSNSLDQTKFIKLSGANQIGQIKLIK